jgi:XTP/dITP diphosphohydrolase
MHGENRGGGRLIKEVVLATRNVHKGAEITALLGDLGIKVRTLAEFPHVPDTIEDGATCRENAIKKATLAALYTELPSVADDTGLAVDALDGRPGVHAARYAGHHATYEDNWRKLLQELEGIPRERRTARFMTVAAIARPQIEEVDIAEGVLEGLIVEKPEGTQGFGYDPVFLIPELAKTLAALTREEKNRISHRARAFAKVRELLKTF